MCATSCKYGLVLLVFLSASAVVAQPNPSNWGRLKGGYQPARPLPPEFGFSYHHASTAYEGWLRGCSQVIHATGNYWLRPRLYGFGPAPTPGITGAVSAPVATHDLSLNDDQVLVGAGDELTKIQPADHAVRVPEASETTLREPTFYGRDFVH